MSWTAIVPIKARGQRKSRLAARLSADERARLADAMVTHVLAALRAAPSVRDLLVLSPAPIGGARWLRDEGRDLNEELAGARAELPSRPLLIVHGDLPLLGADDVEALAEAGRTGAAFSPDRRGLGTNALAIPPGPPFAFSFGVGSAALHRAAGAREVRRPGFALDVDSPDDLDTAVGAGAGWLTRI